MKKLQKCYLPFSIWFSVLIQGPKLLSKYQVKACSLPHSSPDVHLFKRVKTGLLYLLKKRIYFASEVSTPYFYVVGKYHFFQLVIKCMYGAKPFISFVGILNSANTEKINWVANFCKRSEIWEL